MAKTFGLFEIKLAIARNMSYYTYMDASPHAAKIMGEISEPRDTYDIVGMKPNILYDFNGSGQHFDNPDPRYLLPVGSTGLILKHVVIDDEDELLRIWCLRRNIYHSKYRLLKNIPILRDVLLHRAWQEIYRINEECRKNTFVISICHRPREI